ncbi:sugar kinase [Flavihumibacter sp. ZG627]|uniref:sugar kinase n=1 Tax=Flavihumibacter sp. ZG627 TaxID=1463156 RepID=UPI00057F7C45|nr:sugar kinase [Flavihumibacter sp. ZG627]KIC90292.1 carbohydrate kinase [Flavihumibacter sp. ZG627]
MKKVFCFGELLMRLSPSPKGKWIHDASMPVYIGGAELNVANALAKWNIPVKYFTALPDNFLSREIVEDLTNKNIDCSAIHYSGNRIGTYYLTQGADLKNAALVYDRAGSSFADLKPGMINWDSILDDCQWFHFSAISPALNDNIAALCKEALEVASAKRLTISVDLNYRSKLWQYGKRPVEIMPALVKHAHLIMGNIWSAESLLGIESPLKGSDGATRFALINTAEQSMVALQQQFPQAKTSALTFRMDSSYWAIMQHEQAQYISKEFALAGVIEKAGSGDCFMAGLIYGMLYDNEPAQTINFAAAAAAGKLYEKGDATHQSIQDVANRVQETA